MNSRKRSTFRRRINSASKLRIVAELPNYAVDEWLNIYRQRYKELGANPYPDELHRRILSMDSTEVWTAWDDERLVGGTLFLMSNHIIDYFSSAYLSEYRDIGPTTAVLNQAFESFVSRSISWFNWQSSPGRGGVFTYKQRWGAEEAHHYYLSTVLNDKAPLFSVTPERLQSEFPLRFVVPFNALRNME